ncbi:c-type cytochrome [Ruegeria arenilitoris]|uniref:c-type cytochrome n=1 Tax=Ruegeria arenilitoris TaxID=1173585 RepID=UPI00147C31CF
MFRTTISAAFLALVPLAAVAEGDVDAGEKVFRKCKACHTVGEGAENKVGPMLNGIVGRQAATVEGFGYSPVLISLSEEGLVWTPEELDAFLTKPRDYAKGIKMTFAGLRKEEDRVNIIAYLATFEDEGS